MLKQCPLTPNLVESDKQTLSRQVASLNVKTKQPENEFEKRFSPVLQKLNFNSGSHS